MRITIADTRSLAVAVSQPATDCWYNWTTYALETPFLASAHLKPLAPLEAAPSIFAGVLTVDVGSVLLERTDVVPVLITVDAAGTPIAPVDVWTLPSPTANPGFGGYSSR
jgi:hypothetical protein